MVQVYKIDSHRENYMVYGGLWEEPRAFFPLNALVEHPCVRPPIFSQKMMSLAPRLRIEIPRKEGVGRVELREEVDSLPYLGCLLIASDVAPKVARGKPN